MTSAQGKQWQAADVQAALGYKPLSRAWAKAEITLGLLAAGIGVMVGTWAVSRPAQVEWPFAAAGLAPFVLGGYLALAGHRSHLYQSNNELTALVLDELRRGGGGGNR